MANNLVMTRSPPQSRKFPRKGHLLTWLHHDDSRSERDGRGHPEVRRARNRVPRPAPPSPVSCKFPPSPSPRRQIRWCNSCQNKKKRVPTAASPTRCSRRAKSSTRSSSQKRSARPSRPSLCSTTSASADAGAQTRTSTTTSTGWAKTYVTGARMRPTTLTSGP